MNVSISHLLVHVLFSSLSPTSHPPTSHPPTSHSSCGGVAPPSANQVLKSVGDVLTQESPALAASSEGMMAATRRAVVLAQLTTDVKARAMTCRPSRIGFVVLERR